MKKKTKSQSYNNILICNKKRHYDRILAKKNGNNNNYNNILSNCYLICICVITW